MPAERQSLATLSVSKAWSLASQGLGFSAVFQGGSGERRRQFKVIRGDLEAKAGSVVIFDYLGYDCEAGEECGLAGLGRRCEVRWPPDMPVLLERTAHYLSQPGRGESPLITARVMYSMHPLPQP